MPRSAATFADLGGERAVERLGDGAEVGAGSPKSRANASGNTTRSLPSGVSSASRARFAAGSRVDASCTRVTCIPSVPRAGGWPRLRDSSGGLRRRGAGRRSGRAARRRGQGRPGVAGRDPARPRPARRRRGRGGRGGRRRVPHVPAAGRRFTRRGARRRTAARLAGARWPASGRARCTGLPRWSCVLAVDMPHVTRRPWPPGCAAAEGPRRRVPGRRAGGRTWPGGDGVGARRRTARPVEGAADACGSGEALDLADVPALGREAGDVDSWADLAEVADGLDGSPTGFARLGP